MNKQNLVSYGVKLDREFLERASVERVVHASNHKRDKVRSVVEHDLRNYARAISELFGRHEHLLARLGGDARAGPIRPGDRRLGYPSEAGDID